MSRFILRHYAEILMLGRACFIALIVLIIVEGTLYAIRSGVSPFNPEHYSGAVLRAPASK